MLRILATVAACAIISNAPSLGGEFVFDDTEAILGNSDVTGDSPLRDLFSHDFWGNDIRSNRSHKSYRPITVLSFRLDAYLGAGQLLPAVFHLHNICLYALLCMLYRHAVCRLTGCRETADWSAVLFALHPLHTEPVSGLVGRAEILSALLFLLALLAWRRSLTNGIAGTAWLIAGILLAGAAMLCKEQGLTALGVCAAWEALLTAVGKVKWQMWRLVVYAALGASLLWLRWRVMAGTTPTFQEGDNPASFAADWSTRVLSYLYIWSLNAYLLALPFWLCFDWSLGCVPLVVTLWDYRNVASLSMLLLAAALAWRCVGCLKNARNVELTGALVAVIVPFFPATNLLFRVGFVVAERTLFLPSMGSCFLVALGAKRATWLKRPLACLCLLFLLRSYSRSADWVSEERLYRSGLSVCPGNAKVHYNVANVVAQRGGAVEAEERYTEAIRLHPEYDQALNNLGNLLRDRGALKGAHALLSRAVNVSPQFAAAWMNKGIVETALGQLDQSEESLRTAIRHRKRYPDALYNLGNLYLERGDAPSAQRAFRASIALRESHAEAWANLCLSLHTSGLIKEAETELDRAIRLFPSGDHFRYLKGNLLGAQGRYPEAEALYRQAILMRPDKHNYHGNLGVLYHLWDKPELAAESYARSLQLFPGDVTTQQNYRKLTSKTKLANNRIY